MPKIEQLSSHVADLIAAGEVVERPASAMKELLENAVDAGAKHIVVELQNGGMTFLRVTDDGCGMDAQDAETAFLRHATSKIRGAEDLEAIGTLGFRGEALAAIASVSRIDLLTRTAEADAGISLRLDAGLITERGPAGCPVGTTIIVRDLFYNTPARMKFMKSDAQEAAACFASVQKQALSHPDVAFRFLKDGQEQLSTPGDGDLRAAVYCIFGRQFALDLQAVDSHWEKTSLSGFVTGPNATRANRTQQHFFVNGRPVKSRLLAAALEQAYQNRIMTGRFPGCVLHLNLPPTAVDVNVHPAKTEVKFLRERDVFDAVHYGVLGALNQAPARPEIKLPPQPAPQPPTKTVAEQMKQKDFFKVMSAGEFRDLTAKEPAPRAPEPKPEPKPVPTQAAPAVASIVTTPRPAVPVPPVVVSTIRVPARDTAPIQEEAPAPQAQLPMPAAPDYRVVGEVLGTYIVVEDGDDVLFLDKHAAHERILFEKLKARETEIMPQLLMAPITADLGREEAAAVLDSADMLLEFGFEVESFGGDTVVIRQIPSDMDESQAEATLQELAEQLLEGRAAPPEKIRDGILHTIACKAAIKAHYRTQKTERDDLVRQVMARDDIKFCPHGRPICIKLTKGQLERQFGRA